MNETHVRKIFGNVDGYAVVDGTTKGGYLVRSITKAMAKDDIFFGKDLDGIVKQARQIEETLMGPMAAQIIDDHDTIPYEIWFEQRR